MFKYLLRETLKHVFFCSVFWNYMTPSIHGYLENKIQKNSNCTLNLNLGYLLHRLKGNIKPSYMCNVLLCTLYTYMCCIYVYKCMYNVYMSSLHVFASFVKWFPTYTYYTILSFWPDVYVCMFISPKCDGFYLRVCMCCGIRVIGTYSPHSHYIYNATRWRCDMGYSAVMVRIRLRSKRIFFPASCSTL